MEDNHLIVQVHSTKYLQTARYPIPLPIPITNTKYIILGGVEPALIMHQLTCNGVLEGIRICMRGFPNRIPYNEFKKRYWVLGRDRLLGLDERSLVENVVTNCPNFPVERFRLGHTKVFFRAGALAVLEEERDTVVTDLVGKLQGRVLGKMSRADFMKRLEKREMIVVIQRLFRNFSRFRSWKWWQLIRLTQPLIGGTNMEEVSFSGS